MHTWCRMFGIFARGCSSKVSLDKTELKKIRRVMTPRSDGSLLVPAEILEKWKDTNGGRDEVLKMWAASNGQKDFKCRSPICILQTKPSSLHPCSSSGQQEIFLKRLHRRVQSVKQQDLWVDGEFMSEQDMIDMKFPPHPGVLFGCSKRKIYVLYIYITMHLYYCIGFI